MIKTVENSPVHWNVLGFNSEDNFLKATEVLHAAGIPFTIESRHDAFCRDMIRSTIERQDKDSVITTSQVEELLAKLKSENTLFDDVDQMIVEMLENSY